MNNDSSSVLQKATFVLLILIAAALGYLIVRDRLRTEPRAEMETAATASPGSLPPAARAPMGNPVESPPEFAPLRPRATTTNLTRVLTNRVPVVIRTNVGVRLVESDERIVERGLLVSAPAVPVPAAFVVNGGGAQTVPSLIGRATLRGTPPPEKVITMDAVCARLNAKPVTTRFYVTGNDAGLANVFIYIKIGAPPTSATGPGPTLDQVGCMYQPYVLGVQVGQTLNLKNSDAVLHTVHSLTKPGSANKEKNVSQPLKGMVTPFVFFSPEVFVKFKCDVHPWMFAYVGVVDHPWFAVTDKNGNFALPAGLPPGRYTLAAIHLKAGELLQQITVTESGAEPANFTFDVPAGPP